MKTIIKIEDKTKFKGKKSPWNEMETWKWKVKKDPVEL